MPASKYLLEAICSIRNVLFFLCAAANCTLAETSEKFSALSFSTCSCIRAQLLEPHVRFKPVFGVSDHVF